MQEQHLNRVKSEDPLLEISKLLYLLVWSNTDIFKNLNMQPLTLA
jgi:hypothetical protein